MRIDRNVILFPIGFCLLFFGFLLILDELHEFGIDFGPLLPNMSAWSIKPLEHWMWGIALIIIGIGAIYWAYQKTIDEYAQTLLKIV